MNAIILHSKHRNISKINAMRYNSMRRFYAPNTVLQHLLFKKLLPFRKKKIHQAAFLQYFSSHSIVTLFGLSSGSPRARSHISWTSKYIQTESSVKNRHIKIRKLVERRLCIEDNLRTNANSSWYAKENSEVSVENCQLYVSISIHKGD